MTSHDPDTLPTPKWDDIHPLDRASIDYAAAHELPPARLADTIFMVAMSWEKSEYALLYHCVINGERRTFIQGKCKSLGLDGEEEEVVELRDEVLVEARFISSNYWGAAAYVLNNKGKLYSKGSNGWSQLGRGTNDVPARRFGRVPIDERVLSVACGACHCLAVTSSKGLFFGTLWLGFQVMDSVRHEEPTKIYSGIGRDAPRQVAAGWNHGAILTEGGEVLTYGNGECGQTGHGNKSFVKTPAMINSLKGKVVQQIGCTNEGTFILAEGKLYGCGLNDHSQLGLGHNEEVVEPTPIDMQGCVITAFRCSFTLVLALSTSGKAFVFGLCCNNEKIRVPLLLLALNFPREVFATGKRRDSGGPVHLQHPRWQKVMEELTSNMQDLNMKIANTDECADLEMPNRARKVMIQSTQHKLADPVEPLEQTLHTTLKSVEKAWCEQTKREQEKYNRIVAEHTQLQKDHLSLTGEHERVRSERDESTQGHAALKIQFSTLRNDFETVKAESNALKTETQQLKAKHQSLQADLDESKQRITLPVMQKVAFMVTAQWRFMGHALGIDDHVLEHIDKLCLHPVDKVLSTLNKWCELHPDSARIDNLVKCLEGIGRKDIAVGIQYMDE